MKIYKEKTGTAPPEAKNVSVPSVCCSFIKYCEVKTTDPLLDDVEHETLVLWNQHGQHFS